MSFDLPASIGANVRRLRHEEGMTQEQLAEAAGLSVSLIQQIERGTKDPRASTLLALARALGCTVDGLLAEARPAVRPPGRPPKS